MKRTQSKNAIKQKREERKQELEEYPHLIEIVYCAVCGKNPVQPPRKKYCSDDCAKKGMRELDALRKRVMRVDKDVEIRNEQRMFPQTSNQNDKPITAMELYAKEEQEKQIARMIQKALAPQFMEVNNRIQRVEDWLHDKDAHKVYPAHEEEHIQKAIGLLQAYGDIEPRFKTRRRLEALLKMPKAYSERILKIADRRLEIQDDPYQSRLDFENEDEES